MGDARATSRATTRVAPTNAKAARNTAISISRMSDFVGAVREPPVFPCRQWAHTKARRHIGNAATSHQHSARNRQQRTCGSPLRYVQTIGRAGRTHLKVSQNATSVAGGFFPALLRPAPPTDVSSTTRRAQSSVFTRWTIRGKTGPVRTACLRRAVLEAAPFFLVLFLGRTRKRTKKKEK